MYSLQGNYINILRVTHDEGKGTLICATGLLLMNHRLVMTTAWIWDSILET